LADDDRVSLVLAVEPKPYLKKKTHGDCFYTSAAAYSGIGRVYTVLSPPTKRSKNLQDIFLPTIYGVYLRDIFLPTIYGVYLGDRYL
jgi:hypothetical protein